MTIDDAISQLRRALKDNFATESWPDKKYIINSLEDVVAGLVLSMQSPP